MARPRLKRPGREPNQTGREARPSVLREVVRAEGPHHVESYRAGRRFDADSGVIVDSFPRAITGTVRGEKFLCGGKLRDLNRGCGKGCPCITCQAVPPNRHEPAPATIESCPCIRCRRRRAPRVG